MTFKTGILFIISIVAVALSGCFYSPPGQTQLVEQPPTGKSVTVQFRRDALGSAHTLPIPPTTDSQNGAQVSLSGSLSLVNPEWIVLQHNSRAHWIPREAVLLIRVNE